MHEERNDSTHTHMASRAVAWAAFVFAALALFLSIVAFNRAGTDLDEVVKREVTQYQQEMGQVATRAEVQAELVALRTKIAAAEAGEEVASEVATARENIQTTYRNANVALSQEAEEVEMELEQVESEVRTNTARGLQRLESLIGRMEQDVRTDEN